MTKMTKITQRAAFNAQVNNASYRRNHYSTHHFFSTLRPVRASLRHRPRWQWPPHVMSLFLILHPRNLPSTDTMLKSATFYGNFPRLVASHRCLALYDSKCLKCRSWDRSARRVWRPRACWKKKQLPTNFSVTTKVRVLANWPIRLSAQRSSPGWAA